MSDQALLIEISRNLATNTEATKNIEKHLELLNGKVSTQESFTRTLKAAVDMNTASIESFHAADGLRKENKRRIAWLTIENIFKFVFAVAISYLLYKAGIN